MEDKRLFVSSDPGKFNGNDYDRWLRRFRAAILLANPEMETMLDESINSKQPLNADVLKRLYDSEKVKAMGQPKGDDLSRWIQKLYHFLVTLCEGAPGQIIENYRGSNGLEALRLLHQAYRMPSQVRMIYAFQRALNVRLLPETFQQNAMELDTELADYEQAAEVAVPDRLKLAIFVSRVPDEIRKHLLLNPALMSSYTEVRAHAIEFYRTQKDWGNLMGSNGTINYAGQWQSGQWRQPGKGYGY
ncbi:MAG: hypothetical protein EOP33_09870, partial [Rickettsiaceae bacterium]